MLNKNPILKMNGWRELNQEGEHMTVQMYITRRCNFACSYCTHHDNSEEFKTLDEYKALIDLLYEAVKEKDMIDFSFFGGEPTIIPGFTELVDYVLSTYQNTYVTIVTNASQAIEFWKPLEKHSGRIHIFATYQYTQQKCLASYMQKMFYFREQGWLYYINAMLENQCQEAIISSIKQIAENPWIGKYLVYSPIDFELPDEYKELERYFQTIEYQVYKDQDFALKVQYDDGRIEYFQDHMTFKTLGLHQFKFYKCKAGRDHILIDSNGDIYLCLSHIFSDRKPCGNIFTSNNLRDIAFSSGTVCMFDKCISELWLGKERIFRNEG